MDRRTALLVLLLTLAGLACLAPALSAGTDMTEEEKQAYTGILKTASALQTKPPEYYDKIVADLQSRGVLGGHMEEFEQAVSGLFKPIQVEDYHRLFLALYSAGYEEEAEFVYQKYVAPSKTLTPAEAVVKAQGKVDLYHNIVGQMTGGVPAKPGDAKASATNVASLARAAEWPKNTSFSRVTLKDGRSINGHVTERDAKGLWLETDPGAKVYFSKSEYNDLVSLD